MVRIECELQEFKELMKKFNIEVKVDEDRIVLLYYKGELIASIASDGIWIHLYGESEECFEKKYEMDRLTIEEEICRIYREPLYCDRIVLVISYCPWERKDRKEALETFLNCIKSIIECVEKS